ncbi:hypothetical protein BZG36_04032 [Bifiguratus adelaidae]|uniref:PUM-HD domain-containing protein n=1 Tax=Bifiguratus adelaidae TaxID=1938954 RepID=A0A261XYT4_9FUNG|nr:hypothetical protein BZG36_04032 [Bifiguratus adelaidae]
MSDLGHSGTGDSPAYVSSAEGSYAGWNASFLRRSQEFWPLDDGEEQHRVSSFLSASNSEHAGRPDGMSRRGPMFGNSSNTGYQGRSAANTKSAPDLMISAGPELRNIGELDADASSSNSFSARRMRAETMPSNAGHLPYLVNQEGSEPDLLLHSGLHTSNGGHMPPSSLQSARQRSESLHMQPSPISSAFGSSIFTIPSMLSQQHRDGGFTSPPPTTPTTLQLMGEDSTNSIAQTLATLGLDDSTSDLPDHRGHSSLGQKEGMSLLNDPRQAPLSPNRLRSISLSQAMSYPESPPDSGPVTPTSAYSNRLSGGYPQRDVLATARNALVNRPRAISMGTLDFANDVFGSAAPPPHREGSTSQRSSLREEILTNEAAEYYRKYGVSPEEVLKQATMQQNRNAQVGRGGFRQGRNVVSWDQPYEFWSEPELFPGGTNPNGSGSFTFSNMTTMPVAGGDNLPAPNPPSRSLWLGNIDPNLTRSHLLELFSPFGQIESLRIVPEKECAFINFKSVEEVLHARDEVLNAWGGRIGNNIVRVGFGKLEGVSGVSVTGEQPTRALWIGNLPPLTTVTQLQSIFQPFGAIESARILTHKNCGFINFVMLEDAMRSKAALHNTEILGAGTGPVRIGFAKVPSSPLTPGDDLKSKRISSNSAESIQDLCWTTIEGLQDSASNNQERNAIMAEFKSDTDEGPSIDDAPGGVEYFNTIPMLPEPSEIRRVDTVRLREMRKRLDNPNTSSKEVEAFALECMDSCVDLCSDYIGNTVIQKLFERCVETTKQQMLSMIAPHLASIGIHKNGTWAAQKIIEFSRTPAQVELICNNLRPFVPPLMVDQFGNYVVQCCLRIGPSRSQFIFDAIVERLWEIAQGRFGARSIRATLESPHISRNQQKYLAAAIVQNAIPLSTNANGSLLVTWLLDTSNLNGRYRTLAPKFLPHLGQLCTHKLASSNILKIINQRHEADAQELLLGSIFFGSLDSVLEEILRDQVQGVGVIQKVLSSGAVNMTDKINIAQKIKIVLTNLKVQHQQGYRRLIEEVMAFTGEKSMTYPNVMPGNSQYSVSGHADTLRRSSSHISLDSSFGFSTSQPDSTSSTPYGSSTPMMSYPFTYPSNAFYSLPAGSGSGGGQFSNLLSNNAPGSQSQSGSHPAQSFSGYPQYFDSRLDMNGNYTSEAYRSN